MCPLRFILVFFSAILAGFLAWRSFRSSPDLDSSIADDLTDKTPSLKDVEQERNVKKMIQDAFWVFVDMASGSYLWRNLKGTNTVEKVKSS